jgi:hypothetical protein
MMVLSVEADDVDLTELPVTRRTVMAWERAFRGRNLKQLQDATQFTHLYELAYVVARERNLAHTATFQEFSDAYEVYEPEGLDESPDPTNPDQSIAL